MEGITPLVNWGYQSSNKTPTSSTMAIREVFNKMELTLPILQVIESGDLYAHGTIFTSAHWLTQEDKILKQIHPNPVHQ